MPFTWKRFFIIEEHHLYIFFIFIAVLIILAYLKSGRIMLQTSGHPNYLLTIGFYLISAIIFYFIYCWILYGWNRHFVIRKS